MRDVSAQVERVEKRLAGGITMAVAFALFGIVTYYERLPERHGVADREGSPMDDAARREWTGSSTELDLFEKGAERAGRSLDDVDRPRLIVSAVDRDRTEATEDYI